MSWSSQGYFPEYNFQTKSFDPSSWNVFSDGEEDPEIEAYNKKSIDLDGWEEKLKIFYGLSDGLFFKGYIETSELTFAQQLFKKFDGFPVYEEKYGGKKIFNSSDLIYFTHGGFTAIIENRIMIADELSNLLKDFEEFILPNTIDKATKSEIFDQIKKLPPTGAWQKSGLSA